MISIQKKKRHTSGSRSKSRKSKPNDFSVELKPHKVSQTLASHQHTSKQKTQNSLNKSKGSRKTSKNNKKKTKHSKTRIWEESKDASRSISAERKNSIIKMNKTEANFEHDDFQHRIYALKKTLTKIDKPASLNTKQIMQYYQDIHESLQMLSQPLFSLLEFLHNLYLKPIQHIFQLISPYQQLLAKKQMMTRSIQRQKKQNEQLFSQLSEQDLLVFKLKQKVQQQQLQIQRKRQRKEARKNNKIGDGKSEGILKNMKKDKISYQQNIEDHKQQIYSDKDFTAKQADQSQFPTKPNTKGLKIDLTNMDRNNAVGFHDQFYSKIDQFSESWRNQALKEKRF